MNRKLISIIITSLIIIFPSIVKAEDFVEIEPVLIEQPSNVYNSQEYGEEQLKGKVVMVPAKTTFPATLTIPLSSESSKKGDNVSFYLDSDFYYDNNLIAPEGSSIEGSVVKVKKGKYANIDGLIQVRFSRIVTPSGQIIPILASIATDDGTGVLKAGTVKDALLSYTKDAAVGAATGALLGTISGAIGGDVGVGAIAGTAVGGAMSLIKILADKGDDVYIPQDAQMNIILEQPVTFSSNTPY